MKNLSTKKIALAGMIIALCMAVTLLIRLPLVPAVPFLKFDGKDTILAIAGFIFGAGYSLLLTVATCCLEPFFTGNATWVDVVMNIISTVSFVCTADVLYKRWHTKTGAMKALLAGSVCQILVMTIWNYVVDPFYFHMPRAAVVQMLPWIALFNVLKCGLNSGITLFIYKPVVTALRSRGLAPESHPGTSDGRSYAYAGGFVLLTALLVCLCVAGLI